MTLPYLWRLLLMSLAAFFVIHAALSMAAGAGARMLIRWAARMEARRGAGLLLGARLAPALIAAIAVLAFCVPSYLSLEDQSGAEFVGYKCVALAAISLGLVAISGARVLAALARSRRYVRECRSLGRSVTLSEPAETVVVVEETAAVMACAGIMNPAVLVSRRVLETLAPEQIAAALRHERAHAESHDNFRRLCLCAAPGLPFAGGLRAIEREWAKLAEWAADDRAAEGDAGRSLSLAEALVRMARMGALPKCSPLESQFVSSTAEVAERVNRLLGGRVAVVRGRRSARWIGAAACAAGALGGLAGRPATLAAVHDLLERLMH